LFKPGDSKKNTLTGKGKSGVEEEKSEGTEKRKVSEGTSEGRKGNVKGKGP